MLREHLMKTGCCVAGLLLGLHVDLHHCLIEVPNEVVGSRRHLTPRSHQYDTTQNSILSDRALLVARLLVADRCPLRRDHDHRRGGAGPGPRHLRASRRWVKLSQPVPLPYPSTVGMRRQTHLWHPEDHLSVSNSLSGRHWELDQVPAVGDLTDIVQLGTGHHVSAGEGQRRVAFQRRVAAYLVGGGQTPGATQRCLNPGFSERIGNSRRTAD